MSRQEFDDLKMSEKISERDAILEEIHRTRRQIVDKFGGDITAILEDARKRQEASGRPIWRGGAENDNAGWSPPLRTGSRYSKIRAAAAAVFSARPSPPASRIPAR